MYHQCKMERSSEGMPILLQLVLIQVVLASSAVEIVPSGNPSSVGATLTLALSPLTTVVSGSWAVGDTVILNWQGAQQAVFPAHSGRASVNTNTGTLTLKSVTVADSGDYIVNYIVQGSEPTQLRANATITVLAPVSSVVITPITTDYVEFKDTAVLTCSVSSGSSISYLWLNGSSEVTASEGVQLGDGGSTLTIVNVTRYDQGPFRCNASNDIGDGISQPVKLTISYGPDSMVFSVNGQQNSTTFNVGSNLTMSCSARSHPPAEFQWAFSGQVLNGTGPELALYSASESESGPYSCLAFNNKTKANSTITKYITVGGSEQQAVNQWLLPFLSLLGVIFSMSDL